MAGVTAQRGVAQSVSASASEGVVHEVRAETTGERLARAIHERNYSLRGLARELAAGEPRASIDSWRRRLYKYLRDEHVPNPTTATLLGGVLGCEPSELRPSPGQRDGYLSRLALLEQENGNLAQRIAQLEDRMSRLERPLLAQARHAAA